MRHLDQTQRSAHHTPYLSTATASSPNSSPTTCTVGGAPASLVQLWFKVIQVIFGVDMTFT